MIKVFLEKVLFFSIALAGLLFIITIHELGHWSFSKLFNVATPTFSIGFGPRIVSTRIADTEFILAALPLGGYVSIAGLDSTAPTAQKNTHNQRLFTSKSYYQKALIILGGILFNLIFGFFSIALTRSLKTKQALTKLLQTTHNMPQEQSQTQFIGPIGIFTLIIQAARLGFGVFVFLLGTLSINLAFINLLPIPFLDGGQFLMLTLGTFTGLSADTQTSDIITILFLLLFILFIIYISTQDIKKILR